MAYTTSMAVFGNEHMYAKCIQYSSRINEYVQIGSVEITPDIYEIRIKSAQILGPRVDSIQILFFFEIHQDSVFPKIIEGIQSIFQCDKNPIEAAHMFIRP